MTVARGGNIPTVDGGMGERGGGVSVAAEATGAGEGGWLVLVAGAKLGGGRGGAFGGGLSEMEKMMGRYSLPMA